MNYANLYTSYRSICIGYLVGITALWLGGGTSCNMPKSDPKSVAKVAVYPQDESESITIELEQWIAACSPEAYEEITIAYDHTFHTAKRFRGVSLHKVLEDNAVFAKFDPHLAAVIFTCKDGYAPAMPLNKVLTKKGYIIWKDFEAKASHNWKKSDSARYTPFYVAWEEVPVSEHTYPWPYGLVQLQIKSTAAVFGAAIPPSEDKNVKTGFALFKAHCIKCHSINKVGGTMGPELNYPKNITEYWTKEHIWQFIKDPQSYRYNSDMPAISVLDKQAFDNMYRYLQYMSAHKWTTSYADDSISDIN